MPHPLSALFGQWLITSGLGGEQLIINLDNTPQNGWITGTASFTWFPETNSQGGQQFDVVVQADGTGYQATAHLLAEYDSNYMQRLPTQAPPPLHAAITLNGDATLADIKITSGGQVGRTWSVQKM